MAYDLKEFLAKYHVSEEDFQKADLSWDQLMEIRERYIREMKELGILAGFLAERLLELKKTHSIKKRVKDPWHLARKIIWKKANRPDTRIDVDNYQQVISDLIGVRVLHLFKEDWESIHRDISSKWLLREKPVANIRQGDSSWIVDRFKELGLEIVEHKFGYRSIHYQILLLHNKKEISAEIQVRTLFEEAWSEIDHKFRYPDNMNDPLLAEYLIIFNRIAGSADEMGSFIRTLQESCDYRKKTGRTADKEINEIKNAINSIALDQNKKDEIYKLLEKIRLISSDLTDNKTPAQDMVSTEESSDRSKNVSGNNNNEKRMSDTADSLTGFFDSNK